MKTREISTIGKKKKGNFTFSFKSSRSPKNIFDILVDARAWWSGIYSETIKGSSDQLDEEFTFHAGAGAHYTKQRLIELIPGKKIVWLVVESNLSFLKNPEEWKGTKLCFEIFENGNEKEVRFTHIGLLPDMESYDGCAGAWTQYLNNLSVKLT